MQSLDNDKRKNKSNFWDVVIIGGGPAGCSAAMVLARSRRRVLLIDGGSQRNLKSHGLRNYLTRDGILPPDFLKHAYADLARYDVTYHQQQVVKAAVHDGGFVVTDAENNKYYCRKILLATGVTDKIPDVPGMAELWGSAVFHCPFCDGYECCDTKVGLYAQLHNGYGMALALRHLSNHVTLYTDGAYYLKRKQREELLKRGIAIVTQKIGGLVHHDHKLQAVELISGQTHECQSIFVHHDIHINDTLLKQLNCRTSKKGAAITNRKQETSIPGVYVAGDASYDVHFVSVAAAEGVKAAVTIHNALLHEDNKEALEIGADI